jgi:hypothetical protein
VVVAGAEGDPAAQVEQAPPLLGRDEQEQGLPDQLRRIALFAIRYSLFVPDLPGLDLADSLANAEAARSTEKRGFANE